MLKASKSDIEWQVYGRLDYGASHELSSGLEEWSILQAHLRHYGLIGMDACAELGCGAGRLTATLSRDFAIVYALDVSSERIAQARKAIDSRGVIFHRLQGPSIPIVDATCDLCISTHVLQHISDSRVIEASLCEMRRILRPGGCLLLHVPVIGAHGMTGHFGEMIRRRCKEIVKSALLTITRWLMLAGFCVLPWKVDQYNVFSFVDLNALLCRIGFEDVELRILPRAGGHAYVFARASNV